MSLIVKSGLDNKGISLKIQEEVINLLNNLKINRKEREDWTLSQLNQLLTSRSPPLLIRKPLICLSTIDLN